MGHTQPCTHWSAVRLALLTPRRRRLSLKECAQWDNPVKGDWVTQVDKDLKDIELSYTMEKIEVMSVELFRVKVREAIQNTAFTYLCVEKEKLSKVKLVPQSDIKWNSIYNHQIWKSTSKTTL